MRFLLRLLRLWTLYYYGSQVGAWTTRTRICVSTRRPLPQRYLDNDSTRTMSIRRRSCISSSISSASVASIESNCNEETPFIFNATVSILDRGDNHVVVSKPSAVICHRSDWTGRRNRKKESIITSEEVPMLQRVREAVGEKVNLVHRLDRGASGCLLFSFAKSDKDGGNATAILQECMTSDSSSTSDTHKTYIAIVRGEGLLKGRDFRQEGWFEVDRPIKDESGNLKNATSYFRFIAGQDNGNGTIDRPRASLVLARIKTGRWHQIRKHLNGLSHPIIGDSTHGISKTNREWIEKWDLKRERICLHLLKLELPPTSVTPNGIDVVDSLPPDMMNMLQSYMPELLKDAENALNDEGLSLNSEAEPRKRIVPISLDLS
jgi:tRNA pseudouridine65 synthase